jgi:DnaA family protein
MSVEHRMKQIALDIDLGRGPTLDNFLPGPNQEAFQHLRLWAGSPVRSPVPMYLWGPEGSGKSHLLRAVAHALTERGETLGWLDATVAEPVPFDPRWRVILLDDVHQYTAVQQQAAFNWFVHAATPGEGPPCGVIAAGLHAPADLSLREDLRTRLGWGHVFQLHLLDEAHRRAVLRQHAEGRGIFLKDEVMDFILTRFSRDLGSLMALLDQLDGYALQTQRPLTIPLIKAMLDDA